MRKRLLFIAVMGIGVWSFWSCARYPHFPMSGEAGQNSSEQGQIFPDPAMAEYFKLIKEGDGELSRGRAEKALEFFQQAADINPRYFLAHRGMGNALAAMGKTEEAIRSLKRANTPMEKAFIHMDLAFVFLDAGNTSQALSHARRAVELEPKNWEIHAGLGQCHLRLGDYDNASAAFRKANSIQETARNHIGIGWADFGKKKFADSLKSFEKAVKIDPSAVTTLYEANARIQHESGHLENAIEFMTKAVDSASNERTKAALKDDLVDYCLENGDFQKASYLMGKKNWIGVFLSKGALGFNVVRAVKNGPAYLAGIRPGDTVVEFEDRPLADVEMSRFVKDMIGGALFGGTVRLKIERQGQYLEKYVVVGISPDLPRLAREALSGRPVGRPEGLTASSQAASRQDSVPVKPKVQEMSGDSSRPEAPSTKETNLETPPPGVRIESLTVNPSPVAPGGDFSVDIQFTATTPSGPPELSLTLNCSIYYGGNKLFEPPADSFKAPNGRSFDVHKKLSAGPQSGKYSLRVRLSGESVSAEKSIDFTIE